MFQDVNTDSGQLQPGLFPDLDPPQQAKHPEPSVAPEELILPESKPIQNVVHDRGASAELDNWKDSLRRDFEQWLASVEDLPDPESVADQASETPDLCSFYEQLAAATAESRKANRRTAEAISQWGDTLSRFDSSLLPLRETIAQLLAAQPKGTEMSRDHCLVLAEWLDRLNRINNAFRFPPAKASWWGGNDRLWRKTWETQQQALAIVISHIEEFLKKQGVTRVETVGQLFDPSTMNAVAAEPDPNRPSQTILEELAVGYRRHGELLRPAQVKVSRHP